MAKEETKKIKRPTALKRDMQSKKRRLINKGVKSCLRTAVKDFEEVVLKKDSASATAALNTVYSLMDKAVKKGVFKQNKADRSKSRLSAKVQALAA